MPRLSLFKLISICSLGISLVACGGGGGNRVDQVTNPGGGGSSSSASTQKAMGYGFRDDFVNGKIGIGIGEDVLSAGGSTSLTITVINADRSPYTDPTSVRFSSECLAAGTANITPQEIELIAGQATVTYDAKGCLGDRIIARSSINGQELSALSDIRIEADTVGSIAFVDAVPDFVYLAGTGNNEPSRVRFRVTGATGSPVRDSCVNFSLESTAGGASLLPSKCQGSSDDIVSAKTDANGYATVNDHPRQYRRDASYMPVLRWRFQEGGGWFYLSGEQSGRSHNCL